MTIEQTNSEETPKKRKPAGAAKRIKELETDYALAFANGNTDEASKLRAIINRIENGETADAAEGAKPAPSQPTSFAADLQEATANAEPEWTWETSEDVIDVPLTDHDRANMLRANGADEDAKAEVDREIDEAKATLKEKKAESETIAARMKDRNRSGAKETQAKKAHWKVGTCFSLNTLVYVDPDTGIEVSRRPLTQRERQLELGMDKALDLIKPSGDAQLNLGDVEPTDITDADALLRDAQRGEEATPSNHTLENDSPDEGDSDEGDDS